MKMVKLTINGDAVSAPAGTTILQAAKQAGIDIPTLCDHPALSSIGACRVCVVEVAGQRNLQAACVFPISEGMEVLTESPRVTKARKLVLDMIFAERNHYCMYCEASGDCELQALGYRYGLDHFTYSTYTTQFGLDASRKDFVMEQNRCVLCSRCIRACSDLVANHTLGLRRRGAKSMVHADANIPFGESSCVECGTCMQVCPTGALFDKRSAFMGRDKQVEHVKSTCGQCSIGCSTDIITRGGNVLRIEGDWDGAVNGGLLCKLGRFNPLYESRQRITTPLVRRKGKLEEATWSEALQTVAKQAEKADAGETGVLTSSFATNEALYILDTVFHKELKVKNRGMLNAAAPDLAKKQKGKLSAIASSDVILVVGADPVAGQPVASFFVKRAVDKGARLIVVDGTENGLAPFAYTTLPMDEIDKAVAIAARADSPIVLYGAGVTKKAAAELKKLEGKASFVALEPGANTYGATAFGFNNGFKPDALKFLYVLLGEQDWDGREIFDKLDKKAFTVVQASFVSPATEQADVVLPMAIWSERAGSLTNTEGTVQHVSKAIEPSGEAKADWDILSLLADKLGKKVGKSLEEITAQAVKELN